MTSGCKDFWVLKGLIPEAVGEAVVVEEEGWEDDGGPAAVGKD